MLGTSDLTGAQIASELGIMLGNDRLLSSLTRHANISKWSFRRPGSISANATTKLIEFTALSSDDKVGDFREYSQSVSAPEEPGDYTHAWGPGGSTTTLQFVITPNHLNTKELSGNYYTFKLYTSSANRASKTSPIKTHIVAISYNTVSAPAGHTNNQTQKPVSPQTIDITGVSTSYGTLYMDSYVSDISGNELARFDDSHTDITMTEYAYPLMKATGSIPSGDLPAGNSPAGYPWSSTGSRFQIYTAATPKDSASTVQQSVGTSYSFYWTLVLMDTIGNQYCAGISDIRLKTYNDDGSQSNDQVIASSTSNTDPTTQKSESGTLSSGSFSYDDQWEVYYDTSYGITYNGTYSAI